MHDPGTKKGSELTLQILLFWSEREDLNLRPLDPQSTMDALFWVPLNNPELYDSYFYFLKLHDIYCLCLFSMFHWKSGSVGYLRRVPLESKE
ncbi:MAG: hypothetical protein DSY70_02920 [Desulfobulbus sp.]|nr:MAG: hypothetical protein DSY70_02920 [Desulfobulbus sp.]